MNDAVLMEVLAGFSDKEWLMLAERPSLLAKEKAGKLFGYLYKCHPEVPEKRQAFAAVYPRKPFDDQRLREDISALYNEVKDFIIERELHESGQFTDYLLLVGLRKKKAMKAYQRTLNRVEQTEGGTALQDEWYYLRQTLIAQEKEQLLAFQPNRSADMTIQEKMEHLDRYYILSKLKLYCEQLNRMHILKTGYQPLLLQEVLSILEKYPDIRQLPQVEVYHRLLLLLLKPEQEHYFKELIGAFEKHEGKFNNEEARNLYRYAQNYCIRMVNQGKESYYTELLNIYKQLLSSGLILDKGEMDHTDYKNIVTVGLRLKEFKWTFKFIETYRTKLPEAMRQGAYLYNKANYYYEAGELSNASTLLMNQNFSDVFYNLSARHLLLKIFYDEDEFDALTFQMASFRVFLLRNKTVSAANRDSNINFLKVMRRLAGAKQQQDYLHETVFQKRLTGIKGVIGKYNPLANKNWLLEKAGELA